MCHSVVCCCFIARIIFGIDCRSPVLHVSFSKLISMDFRKQCVWLRVQTAQLAASELQIQFVLFACTLCVPAQHIHSAHSSCALDSCAYLSLHKFVLSKHPGANKTAITQSFSCHCIMCIHICVQYPDPKSMKPEGYLVWLRHVVFLERLFRECEASGTCQSLMALLYDLEIRVVLKVVQYIYIYVPRFWSVLSLSSRGLRKPSYG